MATGSICAAVLLAACAGLAEAQTSPLYLSEHGGGGNNYIVQGGALVAAIPQSGSREGAIAVSGDVRTAGVGGGTGAQYSLAGAFLGSTYAFAGHDFCLDGTTDGTFNYSIAYDHAQVFRFDRDWQNPQLIWSTGQAKCTGITYDTTDSSFWVADARDSTAAVYHFEMDGTYLGGFTTVGDKKQFGIALDPADDTLWTVDHVAGSPMLHQYSKSGTLLQEFAVAGMNPATADLLGMEFNIPSPGALALMSLGGLAASRRRRA